MKKSISKIVLIALSIALLVGAAIGFAASAETAAPEIISKNIKVNGNYCLMFAVDPATVAGDDVTITIYAETPAEGVEPVQTITKAKTATTFVSLDGDGIENDEVIVFETDGVSAKDIADVWYITTASAGVTSAPITYSVREYAFERLYKNGTIFATENDEDLYKYYQQQFYLELLEVGSAAQELLVNYDLEAADKAPEKLAKDYIYASVTGGTYTVGETTQARGFVNEGDVLTLGNESDWKIYIFGGDGAQKGTKVAEAGGTVTVAGNIVVLPYTIGVTPGLYFEELGTAPYTFTGLTYKNLQGNQGTTHTAYLGHSGFSAAVDTDGDGTRETPIAYYKFESSGDDEHGDVFRVGKPVDAVSGCQGTVHFPVAAGSEDANCVVFELDFMYNSATKHKFNSTTTNSAGELYTTVLMAGFFSNTLATANAWSTMTKAGSSTSQFTTGWVSIDYDAVVDENSCGGDAFRPEGVSNSTRAHDLLPDTWYNICYELYIEENVVIVYIDGEKVASWSPSTFTIANGDIDNINIVSIMADYRLLDFDISLDNVFAGKLVKDCPVK